MFLSINSKIFLYCPICNHMGYWGTSLNNFVGREEKSLSCNAHVISGSWSIGRQSIWTDRVVDWRMKANWCGGCWEDLCLALFWFLYSDPHHSIMKFCCHAGGLVWYNSIPIIRSEKNHPLVIKGTLCVCCPCESSPPCAPVQFTTILQVALMMLCACILWCHPANLPLASHSFTSSVPFLNDKFPNLRQLCFVDGPKYIVYIGLLGRRSYN